MLSIAKLVPGQERYYERSVAIGLDDYYAGRGESPGMWVGRGARELGLEGLVHEGELGRLIRGHHPHSDKELRAHRRSRRITIERIDPFTNERFVDVKKLAPVAGFDLVFSVPKSVSLLHALGDEETRRAVNEAHTSAWQAALAYLEDEACVIRRGAQGRRREHAVGFAAAAYQHRTSRAQDPHLHTHVIVANMAKSKTKDEWRKLDGEPILRTYRLAAGYLYQAHLRAELTRALGVEWETPQKGMAELRHVPRGVIREFSTRRAQIVEELARRGGGGFYAAQVAAVMTREGKEHADLAALREDWRARAAEHGLGARELNTLLGRIRHRDVSGDELMRVACRMLGPKGLTEKRTAFSDPEVVMAWAEALGSGASADRVRKLAVRLTQTFGVERVGEPPSPGRSPRYSTAELVAVEKAVLALVARGRDAGAPCITEERLDEIERADRIALSEEQETMVREVATSPSRVVCVVGLAGAGKTTATHAVAQVFSHAGIQVLGAAPSGVAAEKLQDETGIPSSTLHRVLERASRGGGLPNGSVLVVDEAGMADTRVLAPVLEFIEQANGKAILIGDPQQLPAVGAGGLFIGIIEREGAVALKENRRQRDELEREAVARVRSGMGRDYLAYAERHERLVVSESPVTTRARLLADWWEVGRDDLAGNIMLALHRRDVADLNQLARSLMEAAGRLGKERLMIPGREFAAGDRVVCLRNSDVLGVTNGTTGTVHRVDPNHRTLTVSTDRGPTVELSRRYLEAGNVRHAYALTGHAAQGLTVERAFVLGANGARLQEWGYVALSRARAQTRLYVTGNPREHVSHFHELDDSDPLSRFGRALEESAVERLAVDQRPLSSGPRHRARPEIERSAPSSDDRLHLRLLEMKRRALAKTRDAAERKLQAAERELASCGPLRRRRRDELRAEIKLQSHAIELGSERLAESTALLENGNLEMRRRADRAPVDRTQEIEPVSRSREEHRLTLGR
ncbi:MAG: relaxase domain-containing protein [Actinomycetota bacterium]|nr:relaxase domain-containing protein [Actinomycetota bacterium]